MRPEEALDKPQLRMLRVATETVQAAFFVVTTSVALLSLLWAGLHRASPDRGYPADVGAAVPLGAVALTLACVTAYALGRRTRSSKDDYVIEELDGLLTVSGADGHQRYTYVRRQRIRSTRHDLRLVSIRSHWSGDTYLERSTDCLFPDQILLDGQIPEEDGRTHRWVYLMGPIGKGHRVWVGLRHSFADDRVRMKPYFRESGEEHQVEQLTVRVRFSPDRQPIEVVGVRWRARTGRSSRQEDGEIPCRPVKGHDGRTVEYLVRVDNPDRRCAYGLRWKWAESLPVAVGAPTVASSSDDEARSWGGDRG